MGKNLLHGLIFFGGIALLSVTAQTAEWPLQKDAFEIVIPTAASPSERFAAEELQTYFQKMSGTTISIRAGEPDSNRPRIILGRHPSNEALAAGLDDPDCYRIDSQNQEIRIVGGYRPPVKDSSGNESVFDWGILYGVYQLLEDQGIRWFRPEPEGEQVPDSDTVKIVEGRRDFKPAFQLRWGVALYASNYLKSASVEETTMAKIWALRNRCNVTGLNDPKYGGYLKMGPGGHVYSYWVPRSLFEEHPDFFPLIDGVRTPNGQLCIGNPALQDYVAAKLIKLGQENPQLFMTSIDPNDGPGWCQCPLCQAMDDPKLLSGRGNGLSMSSRVMQFNNIVARKVAEKCPRLLLYSLAYSDYTEAPTRLEKLEDNLVIGLAPFAGAFSDYSRPLEDPDSRPNRRFLESIEGFSKLGAKIYAREYLSHYAWPGPLPLLWVMQDRFGVYEKYGFIGVYSETHPTWGPQGMLLYLYLRLLWNPHLDLAAELEDYCRGFYGPAFAPMWKYHQLIEERGKNGPYFGSGGSHAQNLFTSEFLAKLQPLVTEAAEKVRGQQPYQWRVECVLAGYELARLFRQTIEAVEAGQIKKAKESFAQLDELFGDKYPKGDVFDKNEGRAKNADGTPRVASFLRILRDAIAKADTLESQFKNARVLQMLDTAWKFQIDPEEAGISQGWNMPTGDETNWSRINSGSPWQHQGFSDYSGTAWYRRAFPTPIVGANQRVILVFGGVDGNTTVWINGQEIGRHDLLDVDGLNRGDSSFSFDVTDFLHLDGVNLLALRVKKNTGNGGIHRSVKLLRVDE